MYDVPISWPALIQVPHGKAVWELKWILVPCHKNRGRAHGRAPWQTRAHVPQSNCVGKLWAQVPNSVETSHVVKGAFYPGIDATGSVLYIKVGLKPGMKWGERYCVSCYLVSVMCCAVSPCLALRFIALFALFVCLSVCLFVLVLFYFLLFSFVFVSPTGGTEWKEAELAGSIRECGKSFWHTHLIRHREVLHIGFSFLIGTMHGHQALCSGQVQTDVPLDAAHAMNGIPRDLCKRWALWQQFRWSGSSHVQVWTMSGFRTLLLWWRWVYPSQPKYYAKAGAADSQPRPTFHFRLPCQVRSGEAVRHYMWYDMIWYDMTWYDMIWYDIKRYDMIWYVFIFICIHSVKQALVYYFVLQFVLAQCLSFFFHPVFCPPVAWSLLCA